MPISVEVRHDPMLDGTKIYIVRYDPVLRTQSIAAPVSLDFQEISENMQLPEPTFKFRREEGYQFLQSLSNALTEIGFRPNEIESANRELAAVKYHLEDMRRLIPQFRENRDRPTVAPMNPTALDHATNSLLTFGGSSSNLNFGTSRSR
jgi:hypothetical protein